VFVWYVCEFGGGAINIGVWCFWVMACLFQWFQISTAFLRNRLKHHLNLIQVQKF